MGYNKTPEQEARELALCKCLSARLRYEDGRLFWTASKHGVRNGTVAGYDGVRGYRRLCVSGLGEVMEHRLIFYMHHGYLPKILDHIDGDRKNNRIENLRVVTNQQNSSNTKLSAKNTSGHKGVRWSKYNKKWKATITVHMQKIYLGYFTDIRDAVKARKQAEEKYYGEYARA